MSKCIECKKEIKGNKYTYIENGKICWDCAFDSIRKSDVMDIQPVINVYLKQGNKIIFGDADDYFIDNDNGWLNIYKDGKNRATLSLSQIESVIVE